MPHPLCRGHDALRGGPRSALPPVGILGETRRPEEEPVDDLPQPNYSKPASLAALALGLSCLGMLVLGGALFAGLVFVGVVSVLESCGR